jgi:UDP-N-acetylmuramoylalanine-D-glutamate ligase
MSYALRGIDHGGYTSDYSIFTNIKPDHLNWHRDLMEYVDAKMNLMRNTRKKVIMNHQVIEFIQKYQMNIEVPENMRFFAQSIS